VHKGLIKAKISGTDLIITPDHIEKPHMFYKKMLFVRYLSDPTNNTGDKGLKKFSELTTVPLPVLKRWRASKEVQGLVAQVARDYALEGDGMALVYKEAQKILKAGVDIRDEELVEEFTQLPVMGEEPSVFDTLMFFLAFLRHKGLFVSDLKQKTDIIKTMLRIDDKRSERAQKFELEREKIKKKSSPKDGKSYEDRIEDAEYEVVD